MNKDIKALKKILELDKRHDLSNLLNFSTSNVNMSNSYGGNLFSILSTFEIYSPVEQNHKLSKLRDEDKKVIYDAVIEIYPLRDNEPEITNIEFLISNSDFENKVENIKPENNNTGYMHQVLFIFISYSTMDKILASGLKDSLIEAGFDVFMAHADISPSKEWEDEILYALNKADVFISILTPNFSKSHWTDQECGIAFAKNKLIIPINAGLIPYGFIGRFQALKINPLEISKASSEIEKVILDDSNLGKHIVDFYVNSFAKSKSFQSTRIRLKRLARVEFLSSKQLNTIIEASVDNNQIYGAHYYSSWVGEELNKMILNRKDEIDKNILNRFNEIYTSSKVSKAEVK